MGNISSHKKVGYEELRNSIPGSMLADQDYDLFYSLCKVETIGNLTTVLHPSPAQLFYVVVSGQVVVHLSSPQVPNVCATTFNSGDMIHFFNCAIKPVTQLDNSCITNGNIKLSLHFKGYTEKMGRVIGMDRRGWDAFARVRMEHKRPLAALLAINISDFVKHSKCFETLTPKQVQMLGPLLKVRLAAKGNAICFPAKLNAGLAKNFTSAGTVAVVLSGTCLSIPIAQDVAALTDKLLKESPHSASMRKTPTASHSLLHSISRVISRSIRSADGNAAHAATTDSRDYSHNNNHHHLAISVHSNQSSGNSGRGGAGGGLNSLNLSTDSSKVNSSQSLQAGAILGLDSFVLREPAGVLAPIRKYLAMSSLCVVGYIYPRLLEALCQVDQRLKRVLTRNYHRALLNSVRFHVPMLSGMDDESFAKLSSKVALKGFAAGSTIYTRDQTSDLAYIVLAGAVSLTSLLSVEKEGQVAERLDRVLTWGNMFGDIALVSSSPYFNNATAVESTVVIAISKRTLDEIYFNNKSKLCEIRIKLVGSEVDLLHVIDHPRGSELFKAFLSKVMAVENLEFYHAVDRFDLMCAAVAKLYVEIKKMRAKLDLDMINATASSVKELSAGAVSSQKAPAATILTQPIAEAGPSLSEPAPVPAANRVVPSFTATQTNTERPFATVISSSDVVDPYAADAQLNSAYMAKLFADFDVNTVHSGTPEHMLSYQTDEEEETITGTISGTATGTGKETKKMSTEDIPSQKLAFENLFVRENSGSNMSMRSGISDDDEGDTFPKFSLKCKPQSAKQEEPTAGASGQVQPMDGRDSPFSNLNLAVTAATTQETPRTRMTKSTILREKMNLFSPKHDKRTHPTEQEQIEGLIQSGVGTHPSTTHPGAHPDRDTSATTAGAHKKSSLSREHNQLLYSKVQRRLDKLRQGIVELREVARNIMETFVFEGSPSQVNLSSKTRSRIEKTFREWSLAGMGDSFVGRPAVDSPSAAAAVAAWVDAGDANDPADVPSIAAAAAAAGGATGATIEGPLQALLYTSLNHPSPTVKLFPNNVNVNFTTLFEEAKLEVLKLLRHDNFPRWKRTPEFADFINSVKARDHNVSSERKMMIGSQSTEGGGTVQITGEAAGDRLLLEQSILGSTSGSDKGAFSSAPAMKGTAADMPMNAIAAIGSKLNFSTTGNQHKGSESGSTPLESPQRKLSVGGFNFFLGGSK